LEESFKDLYSEDLGRPAKSVRLMAGLHYLKHLKDLSDDEVVIRWVENPYWQYFCGEEYFQTNFPIHPTSMTKWRKRLKDNQLDKLLETTIQAALDAKVITPSSIQKVNVDTTVEEKNIAYPTDIGLYYRLIRHLVKYAKGKKIFLKQTYERVGKRLLRKHSGYVHAKQMKRATKVRKKMRTNLGRLYREILRKISSESANNKKFQNLCSKVEQAMKQTRTSKNKLYSVHEPHVECISKGKAHKRYEFGCKVGFASTSKEGLILSSVAFHGNPYDGHTLQKTLSMAERITSFIGKLKDVYVDLGYRKHDYTGEANINIVGRSRRNLTRAQRKWYNRRSVIEADIGHMKNEHRLKRNYLKGKVGDKLNAVFSACGYNLRTIYRRIASIFFVLSRVIHKMLKFHYIFVEKFKLLQYPYQNLHYQKI
jgi:IS5 family transposase